MKFKKIFSPVLFFLIPLFTSFIQIKELLPNDFSGHIRLETGWNNFPRDSYFSMNKKSFSHNLSFWSLLKKEKYNFITDLYLTTEEEKYYQPRNRIKFELISKNFNSVLGDYNPAFSPLILGGLKIRGLYFNLNYGISKFSIISGISAFPISSEIDSTGIIKRYGTYRRNLTASQASIKTNNYQFGVTYLDSRDDNNSIASKLNYYKNSAIAFDFNYSFLENLLNFGFSYAISQFKTFYTDEYNEMNKKFAICSFLKFQKGDLYSNINYKYIEPNFLSLGYPSLQNDRIEIIIESGFPIKKYGNIRLSYNYFTNQKNSPSKSNLRSSLLSMSLNLFSIIYSNYSISNYINKHKETKDFNSDDLYSNFSTGIFYSKKSKYGISTISNFINLNSRKSKIDKSADYNQNSFSISLDHNFNFGFLIGTAFSYY